MTIWHFHRLISHRLMGWAVISVVSGLALALSNNKFRRGLGSQFVSWGLINAVIALFGGISTRNRIAALDNPGADAVLEEETTRLRRILLINAGLDVLYILGGRRLAQQGARESAQRGHGVGIIIQGAFLLIFDLVHALMVRTKDK